MRKTLLLLVALAAAALSWVIISPATSQAAPSALTCSNTTVVGGTYTTVTVPANRFCGLLGTTVIGSVKVNRNGDFETCNSSIGGSLNATAAYVNVDHGTNIGGAVTLERPGSSNVVGTVSQGCITTDLRPAGIHPNYVGYASLICSANIGGSVTVMSGANTWQEVQIGGCVTQIIPLVKPNIVTYSTTIGGSVNFVANRLYVELNSSYVYGGLACIDNHPSAQAYDSFITGATVGCLTSKG